MKAALIFDYDGTIHDTMRIYEPAVREVIAWLEQEHGVLVPPVPSQRIASWLGMNKRDMWDSFLPDLPETLRDQAGDRVGAHMEHAVRAHRAAWYPGIQRVLQALRDEGYRMAVLSNCQTSYAKVHWQEFGMDRWFEAFYDCESFGYAPKTRIIRLLAREFPAPYVVIGDRRSDLDCARASGSRFIGCRYGFGTEEELQGADLLAESPEKVLEVRRVV